LGANSLFLADLVTKGFSPTEVVARDL
jgi:hypothetical protein